MTFIIHYETEEGHEDRFVIKGENIEEIRAEVFEELEIRGGKNAWSERMD